MTITAVPNVDPRVAYTALAGQTDFTVPAEMRFYADADIKVYLDGELQTLDVDYTISGANSDTGGEVVFASGLTVGQAVVLVRQVTLQRTADYNNSGDMNAVVFNEEWNRLWMAMQQVNLKLDRTIRLEDFDTGDIVLPEAAARAGKVLGFDDDGNVTVSDVDLVDLDSLADDAAAAAASAAAALLSANNASDSEDAAAASAAAAIAAAASVNLPLITGNALRYLRVNAAGTALEYDALGDLAQLNTVAAAQIDDEAITQAKLHVGAQAAVSLSLFHLAR